VLYNPKKELRVQVHAKQFLMCGRVCVAQENTLQHNIWWWLVGQFIAHVLCVVFRNILSSI
jgi:hypothetical protein